MKTSEVFAASDCGCHGSRQSASPATDDARVVQDG